MNGYKRIDAGRTECDLDVIAAELQRELAIDGVIVQPRNDAPPGEWRMPTRLELRGKFGLLIVIDPMLPQDTGGYKEAADDLREEIARKLMAAAQTIRAKQQPV